MDSHPLRDPHSQGGVLPGPLAHAFHHLALRKFALFPLPKQFSSPAPLSTPLVANTKAFHCSGPTLLGRHLWHISCFPAAFGDWDWSSKGEEASVYIWVTYLTNINSLGVGFFFVCTSEIMYITLSDCLVPLK